ncbi:MAG: hypothetical protein WA213_21025 [Terriglobales bacterium]
MNRVLQIAHLGLLLAGVALCACGARFLWTLNQTATAEVSQVRDALVSAKKASDQIAVTMEAINLPCNTKDPSGRALPVGTLCDIGETMKLAKLNLARFTVIADHEDKRIGVLDAQEAQIASDAHTLALKAGDTVDALTVAAKGLQPLEQNAAGEISDMRIMTAGLSYTIPDIQRTAAELNATSQNVTQVSQHLNETTGDVQQAVHSYLHPTWPKRIWSAITNTGVEAAKFFF